MVRAAPVPSAQADAFVDYMGINIHAGTYLGYQSTAYQDWQGIIDVVGDIGFRNVRDHGIEIARLNQLSAETGAKVLAITEWQDNTSGVLKLNMSKLTERMEQTKQLTHLRWIEGPNEYDGYPDPNWQQTLLQWQSQMYTYAKNDPVLKNIPVLAPSIYGQPGMEVFQPYADFGNMHQYPAGGLPLDYHAGAVARAAYVAGTKPVIASESGYDNGFEDTASAYGVTELASYKYVPRQFMDFYQAGRPNFFLYELADDMVDNTGPTGHGFREYHWGLVREDLSYKPSAYAVKNLIAHLSDAGEEFTAGSLDYTVTGGNADLRQVLLQKRDGSYILALWKDVKVYDNANRVDITNPASAITVNVNGPVTVAEIYKLDSMIPTDFVAGLSQIDVDVLDELQLVHITLDAPADHNWTKFGDGVWATGSNWLAGAPAGLFHAARFGDAGTAAHAVSVNAPVTVAAMSLDSGASYTLSGQQITIDTPMFGAIDATFGAHTIAAPLKLNRDTRITVDGGAALHVNNLLDSPAAIVTKAGTGTLDVNRVRARKIKVEEGTLKMQDGGGASAVDGVAVDASAKLDLRNNSMVIRAQEIGTFESGAYTGVLGMVATGRGTDGLWNHVGGITTSMSDATANSLTTLAVALASETQYAGGVFDGVSVADGDVIVRYTWHGDADLNGELNGDDYFYLDSHILQSGSVFGFHNGDFNYDGELNGDDYFLLDSTILYAQAYGSAPGLTAIPEPGVGLLGFAGAMLWGALSRKRR